jgi:hypothetical protein
MKTDTEQMRQLYDQWRSEGISKQAFCNQNGLGYHKFNYWVKKFRDVSAERPVAQKGFSRIAIHSQLAQPQRQVLATFVFASGARLELFAALDAAFIKELAN